MSTDAAKQAQVEAPRVLTGPAAGEEAASEARHMIDALKIAFTDRTAAHDPDAPPLPESLWESGPPLAVRDGNGELKLANPAFRRIFDALIAAGALTPAADLAAIIEGLGRAYTEDLTLRIDGQPRFFLAWHELVRDPEAGSVLLVSRYFPADGVGSRLRGLQESDERLRDVTRLVSDIIWECDSELVITFVSPRILHLLGYHPHDLVGHPWSFLETGSNVLSERLADPGRRAPFRGLEVRLADKDGKARHFLVHGLPLFDGESGALAGFRGTAQDMTDAVEREQALKQAIEAADSASRAKSQFLANMSHELRTPLNAIIGFTEIMTSKEFGPLGTERYHEYLNSVLESGRHLLTLINQILDVTKIEAGKLELTEDSVEPAELMRSALRVVTETAIRRRIDIESRIEDGHVHLWADEVKLRQVLLNLLSNALKFTPEGGKIEVAVQMEDDGGFLMQVSDTGIGMDPADFETALAPFGQVDCKFTRRFEGTGLGLPLSKALAEAHGGTLTLDSAPGEGTAVSIRLPASRVRTT